MGSWKSSDKNACTTDDPVILIHGMFGWGKNRPLWNFAPPYWPEKTLQQLNSNHIIVEVGLISSDYDRACEAFYQLKGGRVDYGEQHALAMGHCQFGETFASGLFPEWNAEHPVHLIGHSYGATTAIQLYQFLCTDHFGVGSDHRWVKSITSIAGPLSGSTLIHSVGVRIDDSIRLGSIGHVVGISCGVLWKVQGHFPWLKGLYDFRMSQWNQHRSFRKVTSVTHPFNMSKDNVYHTLNVPKRLEQNARLKDMDKIYLFSVVCRAKDNVPYHLFSFLGLALAFTFYGRKSVRPPSNRFIRWLLYKPRPLQRMLTILGILYLAFNRFRKLDLAHTPLMFAMVASMRRHCQKLPHLYAGFDSKLWLPNDGIVNTYSMMYPRHSRMMKTPSQTQLNQSETMKRVESHQSVDLEAPATPNEPQFQRGRWYIYRVDKNHFCGTAGDQTSYDLYSRVFQVLNQM